MLVYNLVPDSFAIYSCMFRYLKIPVRSRRAGNPGRNLAIAAENVIPVDHYNLHLHVVKV